MRFGRAKFSHTACGALVICVLLNSGHAQTSNKTDGTAFTYRLEVGKRLFYTSRAKQEFNRGTIESKENLEIWVLGQNTDGNWHLLIQNSSSSTRIEAKGKQEELPTEIGWALCDFSPDGHFTHSWGLDNLAQFDLFLANIFPPLPGDFTQESISWESADRLYGEIDRYVADRPKLPERSWIIRVSHATLLDDVYLMNQKSLIYVDLVKGIPVYKKAEGITGYGYYAGKSNAIVILDSINAFDALWAERYAREVGASLQTDSTYNDILIQAERNPAQLNLQRSTAEYLMSRANARITIPEIKSQLDELAARLPEDFKQVTERVNRTSKFINKSAPDWTASGFDGQQHSLNDLRGKVVLLDFWHRGCPWCIRSMPLIDQVAAHFKGQPVVVLGVNTDQDIDDALFVIQKLKPIYTNLSGRDLVKKYGVTNYPTFVVVDKNGLVRSIRIGYERELSDQLIEIIEALL